jgi:hypothetical protein
MGATNNDSSFVSHYFWKSFLLNQKLLEEYHHLIPIWFTSKFRFNLRCPVTEQTCFGGTQAPDNRIIFSKKKKKRKRIQREGGERADDERHTVFCVCVRVLVFFPFFFLLFFSHSSSSDIIAVRMLT